MTMVVKKEEDLKFGSHMALLALGEIAMLALMKAIVGFSTGMVVMLADALASFSDMLSIFASYIG